MSGKLLVSCIIPTCNRVGSLRKTILSLLEQDLDPESYEIIVMDNNSTDSTREAVKEISQNSKVPLSCHIEKKQGAHYARNSAFPFARGDILYYTDDDIIADPSMLSQITKAFDLDPNLGVATGAIGPLWESPPPRWFQKHCSNALVSLNERQEKLLISPFDPGVYSAHQAIRRDVLQKSGGFNPDIVKNISLGNFKTSLDRKLRIFKKGPLYLGDGETGLNIKVKKLGYLFAYVGSSVVYHHIPKKRMTQSYLNIRMYNQGNADSYTYYREYLPHKRQLQGQITRHIFRSVRAFLSLLRRSLFFSSYWHLSLARIFYCIARINYDFRLLRDKEFQKFVLKENWLSDGELSDA